MFILRAQYAITLLISVHIYFVDGLILTREPVNSATFLNSCVLER